MGKVGIKTASFGFIVNLALFFVKFYLGISSNSLSIYCDAVNNLADVFSCAVVFGGFVLMSKLSEKKGARLQALLSFVISLVVGFTGFAFVYNGTERFLYPVTVSYSKTFAAVVFATIIVKVIMAAVYFFIHKKSPSPVFKTLILDSVLDSSVTLMAFLGFSLIEKVNFAVDGIFGIVIGLIVSASAIKTLMEQAKFLIND